MTEPTPHLEAARATAAAIIAATGNGRPSRGRRIAAALGIGDPLPVAMSNGGALVVRCGHERVSAVLSIVEPGGDPSARFAVATIDAAGAPVRLAIDADVLDLDPSSDRWGDDPDDDADRLARVARVLRHAPIASGSYVNDGHVEMVADRPEMVVACDVVARAALRAAGGGLSVVVTLPTGVADASFATRHVACGSVPVGLVAALKPLATQCLVVWRPDSAGHVRVSRAVVDFRVDAIDAMATMRAATELVGMLGADRAAAATAW